MAKAPGGIRQKLSRAAEMAKGVQRLHASGIVDLGNLGVTLQTVKNSRVYGPQATMAIQGGRKFPSLPAIVDEHGTLTYKQVDDMSNALARGLKSLGVDEGSVVGLLCRDHSGLVVAMASCGKLGARTVLMNTGFAKPQFAQVCEREGVKVVLHDSEFLSLLDALPAGLPRALTWVDDRHPPARRHADDRRHHRDEQHRAVATADQARRDRRPHQRHDWAAKGRAAVPSSPRLRQCR